MSALARPPAHKAHLNLVPGAPNQLCTIKSLLHAIFSFLPHLFLTLPGSIIWNHVLARWRRRGIVRQIGRPVFADFIVSLTRYILSHLDIPGSRLLFNRTSAYDFVVKGPQFKGYRDWINYVRLDTPTLVVPSSSETRRSLSRASQVDGSVHPAQSGRKMKSCVPSLCLRSISRIESNIRQCLFFIHGGGFVLDTGGNGQIWALELSKEMNLRRKVNFSVFLLDYGTSSPSAPSSAGLTES